MQEETYAAPSRRSEEHVMLALARHEASLLRPRTRAAAPQARRARPSVDGRDSRGSRLSLPAALDRQRAWLGDRLAVRFRGRLERRPASERIARARHRRLSQP